MASLLSAASAAAHGLSQRLCGERREKVSLNDATLKQLRKERPALKELISKQNVVRQVGNGYGVSFEKIGTTYGITNKGISRVLALNGIKDEVVDTEDKLKAAFAGIKTSGAVIVDSDLMQICTFSHPVCMFVEKEGNEFRLYIQEDMPILYFYDTVAKFVPPGFTLQLITLERGVGDKTAGVAIADYLAFAKNPKLLQEIQKTQRYANSRELVMTKLPKALMHCQDMDDAEMQLRKYQSLLLQASATEVRDEKKGA